MVYLGVTCLIIFLITVRRQTEVNDARKRDVPLASKHWTINQESIDIYNNNNKRQYLASNMKTNEAYVNFEKLFR